jgi:retron-type reverse transcriptase
VVYEKDDTDMIMCELRNIRSYKSGRVKRVWIPKTSGKMRPLGIPNQIDRI